MKLLIKKMGIFKILFFSIIGVLTFTCSSEQLCNSSEKANEFPAAKSDQIILEVVTNARGAAYPKEGDILQMRLFESGRFEYDDFPDCDPPKHSSFNVVITKKEAKLDPEDVKELINLAEQPDFLSAKEKYESLHQHTDTQWITTIKYNYQSNEKKIVAVNVWDTQYDQEDKSKYPTSMITLLERVEELKAKAIGRRSTEWLR